MKLNSNDLSELAGCAIEAVKEAGKMIADYADQDELGVEKKSTGESLAAQIVTKVDRMSQDIILKHILPTCEKFDLGILAEESEDDLSRFKKDYFWSIDPMDGTLPFVESKPGYAVSVALVSKDEKAQIGVIYDPLENDLYHAINGQGAYLNQELWKLKFNDVSSFDFLDRGGAVMNAMWVLKENPAYFYKHPKPTDGGGCVWDYAASVCIYEELGAWVSDMHGNPLELNRKESLFMNHKGILFASHETIAKEILK